MWVWKRGAKWNFWKVCVQCRSPGKHDFEILRQLVLPDGTVFRGLLPGRPTRDTLFHDTLRDGRTLLKVGPQSSLNWQTDG